MREIIACNLCGNTALATLYQKTISYSYPWSIFISPECFPINIRGDLCSKCGWIFQNPSYEAHELDRLYNLASPTTSEEAEQLAAVNSERRGEELFLSLQPWLNPISGSILDVGGRNGELMGAFVRNRFSVSVLDMDGGEPKAPTIRKIRLPFLRYFSEQYDVVTMLHVLEHTESPREFLTHAHRTLKENGLIFIEVPSELLTPLVFRHVGDHRHLGYFTKQSLRGFLESTGFTCLSCSLQIGFVGSSLPVIKAVARKSLSTGTWKPRRLMVFKSLTEALHPLPLFVRVISRLQKLIKRS
jgi:SAM-dependent methyltransferase